MEYFLNNFNFYYRPRNAEELMAKKNYHKVVEKVYPLLLKKSSKPLKRYLINLDYFTISKLFYLKKF